MATSDAAFAMPPLASSTSKACGSVAPKFIFGPDGEHWIPNTQGPEGKLEARIAAFDGEGEKDAEPFP
jgi:hypothetical protein